MNFWMTIKPYKMSTMRKFYCSVVPWLLFRSPNTEIQNKNHFIALINSYLPRFTVSSRLPTDTITELAMGSNIPPIHIVQCSLSILFALHFSNWLGRDSFDLPLFFEQFFFEWLTKEAVNGLLAFLSHECHYGLIFCEI